MSCAAKKDHARIVDCLLDHGAALNGRMVDLVREFVSHEEEEATIKVHEVMFEHGLNLGLHPDVLQMSFSWAFEI